MPPSPPGDPPRPTNIPPGHDVRAPSMDFPPDPACGSVALNTEERAALRKEEPPPLSTLPPARKTFLMVSFCLSMFIDSTGGSAMQLLAAPVAADLGIALPDAPWIVASYALAFAAALLLAGRLADLFAPDVVYTVGFAGMGVLYLVISFLRERVSFFVLRAVCALFAVLTVPASINMIVQMYPAPAQQARRLALFAFAGALAATLALPIAGAFVAVSWRWFFRFVALVSLPIAGLSALLLPRVRAVAGGARARDKLARMDLAGVALLMAGLVLFVLAFTQAGVAGWRSAAVVAPLILSFALVPVFLIWEQRRPRGYSLLPHDIWQFPNIFPLIIHSTTPFLWFMTFQLRIATYWQDVLGDSAIGTAVKLLPMCLTSLVVGLAAQRVPALLMRPRIVQPACALLCFASSMLIAFSGGGRGRDYWRLVFPAELLGGAGSMLIFVGMTACLIQSFPLEYAGIAGSFANVVFQVGGVAGVGVQAGLLAGSADEADWTGSRDGFFFTGGYVLATGLVMMAWFREPPLPAAGAEAGSTKAGAEQGEQEPSAAAKLETEGRQTSGERRQEP